MNDATIQAPTTGAAVGLLGIGSPGIPTDLFAESTVRENLLALMAQLDSIRNDRTDWARRYRSDWYLKSAFYERDQAWLPSVLGTVAP